MGARVDAGARTAELYGALGLPPTASSADVRRAFRTLVRRYHPDANPAARTGEDLGAVVGAYRQLGRLGKLDAPVAAAGNRPARPLVDVFA